LKKYAIIVAGGTGTRMKSAMPKQFLLLSGSPMLIHSLRVFYQADPEIELIVALSGKYHEEWKKIGAEYGLTINHQIVEGGETRFHSVKNGLHLVGNTGLVAIHDAARPLITPEFICHCFESASKYGSAVPVVQVSDSLRQLDGNQSHPIDRSRILSVQTPQVFKSAEIKKAYEQTYHESFTDDATVLESAGGKIFLVEGLQRNIKITSPHDLIIAESLFQSFD